MAALLIMLSVIMQCTCREQDKKRTDKTEREREREMRNRHKSLVKDGKDEMEPQAPNAAFEGGDQRKAEKTAASLGPTENNYDTIEEAASKEKEKHNTPQSGAATTMSRAAQVATQLNSSVTYLSRARSLFLSLRLKRSTSTFRPYSNSVQASSSNCGCS